MAIFDWFKKQGAPHGRPVIATDILETRALYAAPEYGGGYVSKVWQGDCVPPLRDGALRLVYVEREEETRVQRVWWHDTGARFAARVRRRVRVTFCDLPHGHGPQDVAFMFGNGGN
jgi:hypothetical protein